MYSDIKACTIVVPLSKLPGFGQGASAMNTVFFLMAQFGPKAAIPIEDVRREYFSHLELNKFMRKLNAGDIPLPVTRVEKSLQSAKYISLMDLALYIDEQMARARKERDQLCGRW